MDQGGVIWPQYRPQYMSSPLILTVSAKSPLLPSTQTASIWLVLPLYPLPHPSASKPGVPPPQKKTHTGDTAPLVRKQKKCQGSLFTTVVYKKRTARAAARTAPSIPFARRLLPRSRFWQPLLAQGLVPPRPWVWGEHLMAQEETRLPPDLNQCL